jgi:hypothetical protein
VYGAEVPHVNPYVDLTAINFPLVVNVSVEQPLTTVHRTQVRVAVILVRVTFEWEVTQVNGQNVQSSPLRQNHFENLEVFRSKSLYVRNLVAGKNAVVITWDQSNPAVQPSHQWERVSDLAHSNVAHVENEVVRLDKRVPVLYNALVHGIDRGKRTVAQFDDALVSEVCVRSEPNVSHRMKIPDSRESVKPFV